MKELLLLLLHSYAAAKQVNRSGYWGRRQMNGPQGGASLILYMWACTHLIIHAKGDRDGWREELKLLIWWVSISVVESGIWFGISWVIWVCCVHTYCMFVYFFHSCCCSCWVAKSINSIKPVLNVFSIFLRGYVSVLTSVLHVSFHFILLLLFLLFFVFFLPQSILRLQYVLTVSDSRELMDGWSGL